jgi:hypothetical protein
MAQDTDDPQPHDRTRYRSYLLRLWQVRDGKTVVWRALLERPGSGERIGFGTPEALFAFLEAEMRSAAPGPIDRLDDERII